MKLSKTTVLLALAAVGLNTWPGAAQAALVSLGDGTVKDTNTNLIWLQDWNVNGAQPFNTQRVWAFSGLDGFAGSNDWRLPEIQEYRALFAAYGDLTRVSVFQNVQSASYWSFTFLQGSSFYMFNPTSGSALPSGFQNAYFAVAVRTDNSVATVPEPQTLALGLAALGALALSRKQTVG